MTTAEIPGAGMQIRPMSQGDIAGVTAVVDAANAAAERAAGREPSARTEEDSARFRSGMSRFVTRDPAGAWVAVDGDRVVGMAEAIRRGEFWGLSMLFAHPEAQNHGLGRRLLDVALSYADGAAVRMIMTSTDPRALRRYALAGHAIHPAVEASGPVDRTAIPSALPGRAGDAADLDLVAAVDAGLRGSRAEDVGYLHGLGARLEVIDGPASRGYAVHRHNRLLMLGATDEGTAAQLLWRFLAESDGTVEIWCVTAAQNWAVQVALAARLSVVGAGPLFLAGRPQPPGPWMPSGWYF